MNSDFTDVILNGGKKCRAVRRGGLKSTCARVATIWAVLNGHRIFVVLVGATDGKANEHRKNFFAMMQSSPLLLLDYPEIGPLLSKNKQPKRQYRLDGRLLEMSPKTDRGWILFPDIHESESCQSHVVPYSVMATDVSGLSFVDRHGVTIRPDLIIYDDVQTPQSARSRPMTEEREGLITKTFGGLAGIGQVMATIMVCTVRLLDDLSDRFLTRKVHPDWDGKRYPSIIKLPTRMNLWDRYGEMLRLGDRPEDGKALAQGWYLEHRAEMDEGAIVAWEHDLVHGEISALQSLMTVRSLDPDFFECEIQQEGKLPINSSGLRLDSKTLQDRLSFVDRGTIPDQAMFRTAFVDSSDEVLWWMVCAWKADFSGWIVDYGTWPDQGRKIFYKQHLLHTISDDLPHASWEEAFVHAHNQLDLQLFAAYPQLDLMLKDWSDGEHMPRIRSQIEASENMSRIRPSKGFAIKPGRKPVHLFGTAQDNSYHTSSHWVERRKKGELKHIQFDANIWKSHAARRLLTTIGAPSAVSFPGNDPADHRLLREHFMIEIPTVVSIDEASGIAWEQPPGDQDLWDCFAGNCMAASRLGCALLGESKRKTRPRKRNRNKASVSI